MPSLKMISLSFILNCSLGIDRRHGDARSNHFFSIFSSAQPGHNHRGAGGSALRLPIFRNHDEVVLLLVWARFHCFPTLLLACYQLKVNFNSRSNAWVMSITHSRNRFDIRVSDRSMEVALVNLYILLFFSTKVKLWLKTSMAS